MSQETDQSGRTREVRLAGDEPPDIPAESTLDDLLPRLLEGVDDVATGYLVRATLPTENPNRAAQQLVDALERKVAVLGSTLDAGIDPVDPQVDVLIQCEYTASQVASALGGVTPVQGAVVTDVTDVCERVLDEQTEEADAADANDVFSELQQQVNELDYDQVVAELEDVSFPGGPDPDEEVDLEAEADVDLGVSNGDGDASLGDVSLGDVSLDDGALDEGGADGDASDGNGTAGGVDLGSDDVDAKELFGEDGSNDDQGSAIVGGADEKKIEEAVRSIEQQTDDSDATDADATDANGSDAGIDSGESSADDSGDAGVAGGVDLAVGDGSTGDDSSGGLGRGDGEAGEVGDLVDDLVAALESGAVGPERRQRLREALGVESTHSLDVRLEYVQKRVDNLAAYTDAWEAFLAEEGTGNQFVEDVENIKRRLDELEKRL